MKKATFFTLTALAVVVTLVQLTSCGEKEHLPPVVTIDEPTEGAIIVLPDSTHIEGKVTDDDELHEMSIVIKNSAGDTVFAQYPTVHALKTHNYHYHFYTPTAGTYRLYVVAEDHQGGIGGKEVSFQVM